MFTKSKNKKHLKKVFINIGFAVFLLFAATTVFSCDSIFDNDIQPESESSEEQMETADSLSGSDSSSAGSSGGSVQNSPGAESGGTQAADQNSFTRIIPPVQFEGYIFTAGTNPDEIDSIIARAEAELLAREEEQGLISPSEADAFRSALPLLPTDIGEEESNRYVYYVKAYGHTTGNPAELCEVTEDEVSYMPPESGSTFIKKFRMSLEVGKDWTIEAGLKKKPVGTPGQAGYQAEIILLKDTFPIVTTETNALLNHAFVLKPLTGGQGKIDLKIILDSQAGSKVGSIVLKDDVTAAVLTNMTAQRNSATEYTILSTASDGFISSGQYPVRIVFMSGENGTGYQQYCSIQTINIFNNLTTNKWDGVPLATSGGSGGSPQLNKFLVTDQAITDAANNMFYVGNAMTAASDSNTGSPMSPFASLQKAVNTIAANGSASKSYTIFITQTIETNSGTVFPSTLNGKAASIRIEGKTITGNTSPALKLSASGSGSVIRSESSVPVSFEKLEISGGKGTDVEGVLKGGGIYIAGGSVTVGSGVDIKNNSVGTTGAGSGVYVAHVGSGSTASSVFKMKGAAKVSAGNDVCLAEGESITVQGLTGTGAVAVITPEVWKRNSVVLTGTGITTAVTDRFPLNLPSPDPDEWSKVVSADGTSVKIDAPIYVGEGGSNDDPGTRTKPFASLNRAMEELTEIKDYTIYVKGTITGKQTLSKQGESWGSNAGKPTGVTITVNKSTSIPGTGGVPDADAVLDAGLMGTNSYNPALLIQTKIPVTIEHLTITGGNNSYADGGGIQISNMNDYALETVLKLGNGVVITGNYAGESGGGLSIPKNAVVFMYGSALIGDATETLATGNNRNNITASANTAGGSSDIKGGGGIYCRGKLYLGYTGFDTEGNPVLATGDNAFTGGVCRNYTQGAGGGILARDGFVMIAGGKYSYNYSEYKAGGAVSLRTVDRTSASLTISGGTFEGNKAKQGGAISVGTYTTRSGAVCTMTGGTIGGNSHPNTATEAGGAVYIEPDTTFSLGGSAYIPYGGSIKSNDVYLAKTVSGDTVKYATLNVTNSNTDLTGSTTLVAAITPQEYKRGIPVLSGTDAILGTFTAAGSKLQLSENDSDWTRNVTPATDTESGKLTITSPVYVVDSAEVNSTRPAGFSKGLTATAGGLGTMNKPFSNISDATSVFENVNSPAEIIIVGTVNGAQSVGTMSASELTIKGYMASGETSSSAKLYGNFSSASDSGTVLTLNANKTGTTSAIPVIIKDLTISGGNTTGDGGGIKNSSGTLTLAEGVRITGNRATGKGGGIYNDSGMILMYGDAWVGDSTATLASGDDISSNQCANTAQHGGGIYNNNGKLAFGYSAYTSETNNTPQELTGGVGRNYVSGAGGGIYSYSDTSITSIKTGKFCYNKSLVNGGGLYICKLYLSGGTIYNNEALKADSSAGKGGGVYINTGFIEMSGGIIKSNSAYYGGGVYISPSQRLTMSGGVIGGDGVPNTAVANGGGVFVEAHATFNVSAAALVWQGSEKSNDVCCYTDNFVTLADSLNGSGNTSSNKMVLTPFSWGRGKKILGGGAKLTSTELGKFKISDDEWSILSDGTGAATVGRINADIWVAGKGADGSVTLSTGVGDSATGGLAPSNDNRGTKKQPYATIKKAVQQIGYINKKADYTINIDGTLTGTQQIYSDDLSTDQANKLILLGTTADGTGVTNPTTLNGGFTSSDKGTTLSITTPVPIEIKNLKITGGYASSKGGGILVNGYKVHLTLDEGALITGNSTSSNGGGIYFVGANSVENRATLIMKSNAQISGNYANSKGGGVYLEYADLCMSGNALIGQLTSTNDYATSSTGNHSNKAESDGGGVYCRYNAKIRLGYASPDSNDKSLLNDGYGIIYNYSADNGGGICVFSGDTIEIDSGSISKNGCYRDGGAVFVRVGSAMTMTGGSISYNYAGNNGGGVCVESGSLDSNYGTFSLEGGTFTENTVNNSSSYNGGAICVKAPYGIFNIKGSPSLPSSGLKNNDVYLHSTVKSGVTYYAKVNIAAALGNSASLTITPPSYDGSIVYLSESSTGLMAANFAKISVTPDASTSPATPYYMGPAGKLITAPAISAFAEAPTSGTAGVCSVDDFNTIARWVRTDGKDLSGVTIELCDDFTLGYTNSSIGYSSSKPFKGTIDGKGHTITYDGAVNSFVGYAGTGAVIKNLTFESANTISFPAVADTIEGTTIQNCVNYCNVSYTRNAGGIVGTASSTGATNGSGATSRDCVISDCVNYGSVTATGSGDVGGIVSNGHSCRIINCEQYGNVSNLSTQSGALAGGIVGRPSYNVTGESVACIIENCCVTGNVTAGLIAGGIIGGATNGTSRVLNCCFAGTVSGGSKSVAIGAGAYSNDFYVSDVDLVISSNSSATTATGVTRVPAITPTSTVIGSLNSPVTNISSEMLGTSNYSSYRTWTLDENNKPKLVRD